MKKKNGMAIIKNIYIVLIDIAFVLFFLVCSALSNDVPIFAAFGYLVLFNYPILRGILSYIITRQVWLPNLILLGEIFIIPTILTGEFVLTSLEDMFLMMFIFNIPVGASLITSAISKSKSKGDNSSR